MEKTDKYANFFDGPPADPTEIMHPITDLQRDYARTFGTDEGQRVLADLLRHAITPWFSLSNPKPDQSQDMYAQALLTMAKQDMVRHIYKNVWNGNNPTRKQTKTRG